MASIFGKSQVFKPNTGSQRSLVRKLPGYRRMIMGLPRIAKIDRSLAKMIKSHAVSMFQVFLIPLHLLNLYIKNHLFIYLHTHLQKQRDTYTWYMSCYL